MYLSIQDCELFLACLLLPLLSVFYWLCLSWEAANADFGVVQMFGGGGTKPRFAHPSSKPQGYSYFPKEISPTPVSWVKETGNFVHTASHEEGGHFAAMEKPEVLWGDVEGFVKAAWK